MANPSPQYPNAIVTPFDYSTLSTSKLGTSNPSHTDSHGKIEEEVEEVQKKLGIGASNASDATAGQVLIKNGDGTTGWGTVTGVNVTRVVRNNVIGNTLSLDTSIYGENIIVYIITGDDSINLTLADSNIDYQVLYIINSLDQLGNEIQIGGANVARTTTINQGYTVYYVWTGSKWVLGI